MQGTEKTSITWILVADAKTAQIYAPVLVEHRIPLASNSKRHPVIEQHTMELTPVLAKALLAESPAAYEIGRNATGMIFKSFSSARHMGQPHVDTRKEVKQHFAQCIANFLSTAKMGKAFDRLVLVAPPEMLGEIDARLEKKIRKKVMARLPKELTHMDEHALAKHLHGVF